MKRGSVIDKLPEKIFQAYSAGVESVDNTDVFDSWAIKWVKELTPRDWGYVLFLVFHA